MAGAMRFTTDELIETEAASSPRPSGRSPSSRRFSPSSPRRSAEQEQQLGELAAALAELDCEAGLAEVAAEQGYTRPALDDSSAFEIRGGRHPVVEQALRAAKAGAFIENDCVLVTPRAETPTGFDEVTEARVWLVTGPNMAGKSTFLRQNALIAVLAQMGSFVPARSAHIGIVDRLFSRVGAADDLARGRSTFMVEMVETAGILNQATDRSLVILDEIGRGTATFDGLSIAWAVVEYLHEVNRCRALFATHYHELTVLAGRLPDVANVTMDVQANGATRSSSCTKSGRVPPTVRYGIQVAKLAGLPKPVTERAARGAGAAREEPSQGRPTAKRCSTICRCLRRPRPKASDRVRAVGAGAGARRHQPRRADTQGGARGAVQAERPGGQGSHLRPAC